MYTMSQLSHRNHSILPLLLSLLLCAIPLIMCSCPLVPPSLTPVALSDSSSYYLSTLGRAQEAVYAYSINTVNAMLTPLFLYTRTCSNIDYTYQVDPFPATTSISYAPAYGHTLQVRSDRAFIGAPNLNMQPNNDGYHYSSIDIIDIPASIASGTSFSPSASYVSTLFSVSSPSLGRRLAVSSNALYLATTLSESTLAVFSPPRAGQFDSNNYNDSQIALPDLFSIGNLALDHNFLLVAGYQRSSSGGICLPTLIALYNSGGGKNWGSTWDSFTLNRTVLASSPVSSPWASSSVSCSDEPAVSIDFIGFNNVFSVVVGVPAQGCVYAGIIAAGFNGRISLVGQWSVQCPDPNLVGSNFGKSVSWESAQAASLVIASDQTVNRYTLNEFKAGVLAYQFPNTLEPNLVSVLAAEQYSSTSSYRFASAPTTSATGGLRSVQYMAARSGMALLIQTASNTYPDTEIVPVFGNLAGGYQYNYVSKAVEACTAGRVSAGNTYGPCTPCPTGTYQFQTAQTTCIACSANSYCPAGSVRQYTTSDFNDTGVLTFSTLPFFQMDSYRESFEELLVLTIFSVTYWPSMIIFFCLIGICFTIFVCSYWADPDGDEKECCSNCGNCCLHTYRLLGRFKYFTRGKRGPFPYSAKQQDKEPEIVTYSKNEVDSVMYAREHKEVTEVTEEVVHHDHSPEFEGFMCLVFILFALSAVCYTGIYLRSYDPDDSSNTHHQNIFRTRETIIRGHEINNEFAYGIDQLFENQFTVKVGLIGLSGATCSASSLILSFNWPGCYLPAVGTDPPLSCSTLLSSNTGTVSAPGGDSSSCDIYLQFPTGTTVPTDSTLSVIFPPSVSFQAVRFTVQTFSRDLPQFQDSYNSQSIAASTFQSTYLYPNTTSNVYVASPLVTDWVVTPVAYRYIHKRSWDDTFHSAWYLQVVDQGNNVIPFTDWNRYIYANNQPTMSIHVNIKLNPFFTINQSQRLVGGQAVLITIILGVVAIYHLVHFAECIFNIIHGLCFERVEKRVVKVVKAVDQNVGRLFGKETNSSPRAPHHRRPVPSPQPQQQDWTGYEPQQQTIYPTPSAYPPTSPYGQGYPYGPFGAYQPAHPYHPATPHSNYPPPPEFQADPNAPLHVDRERYQHGYLPPLRNVRTPGRSPYANGGEGVNIEMQRPGHVPASNFEV